MLTSYEEQTENDQIVPSIYTVRHKFNRNVRSYLNGSKLLIRSRLTSAGVFWISYALILVMVFAGIWEIFR